MCYAEQNRLNSAQKDTVVEVMVVVLLNPLRGIYSISRMNQALCVCLTTPTQALFFGLFASLSSGGTNTTGRLGSSNRNSQKLGRGGTSRRPKSQAIPQGQRKSQQTLQREVQRQDNGGDDLRSWKGSTGAAKFFSLLLILCRFRCCDYSSEDRKVDSF